MDSPIDGITQTGKPVHEGDHRVFDGGGELINRTKGGTMDARDGVGVKGVLRTFDGGKKED